MLPQHGERIEIGRSAIDRVRLNPAIDSADVAQLVEHHLAKVRVAGSSPVIRSEAPTLGKSSTVGWPRGEAAACKAVYTGSNPVVTSQWAIGAAVARFPDTEEVTGSIPVSPTSKTPEKSGVFVFSGRDENHINVRAIGVLAAWSGRPSLCAIGSVLVVRQEMTTGTT